MSKRQSLTLLVAPAGKGRPRMTKAGRAFTPAKTRNKEAEIKYWLHQEKTHHHGDHPLKAILDFYFKKPKSVKRDFPTVKPDLDNVIKLVLDCANGILYDDDKQVISLEANKYYGEEEKICISLEEV
jgi:Holliday junction resolvase RusA-like endonuclease